VEIFFFKSEISLKDYVITSLLLILDVKGRKLTPLALVVYGAYFLGII
jgi:hypothetical protein